LASTHYAEFFLQYMQAFSSDGSRTLWIEEDGCSKQWMRESLIPQWAEASIRNTVTSEHLFGITWWCSHDVNQRFTGFNKLEYDLGLYTNERRLKPLGQTFRRLVAEYRAKPPRAERRASALVIADDTGGDDALPLFVAALNRGLRPAIVLRSRAADRQYLAHRGISRLIEASSLAGGH
jgi:hypothetical protein